LTRNDVVHTRAKTTGIVEKEFHIEGQRLVIIDVGGQKTERKKWIQCFENVMFVLWVTSLGEFDQTLSEDRSIFRFYDSLSLFKKTISENFQSKPIILMLNKQDVLHSKLAQGIVFKDFIKEYEGDNDYDGIVKFITERYFGECEGARANGGDKTAQLYIHQCNATDNNIVENIFKAVVTTILDAALKDIGFDFE